MDDRKQQAKVYEFKQRKSPRLKTVNYVSPEKKEMLKKRQQARLDRINFYIGVGVLMAVVAVLTLLRLI